MRETERREAIRTILSANMRIQMRKTGRDVARLSKDTGLAENSIYRLLRGDAGATVDSIAVMAEVFEIAPAVLLMPVQ